MNTANYYIATGSKGKMFTLRINGVEERQGYNGIYEVDYDRHVRTLSNDLEKATTKVMEILGDTPFTVRETSVGKITHSDDVLRHFRFPNGRNMGMTLEEINEPTYKIWWWESYKNSASYSKFVANIEADLITSGDLINYKGKVMSVSAKETIKWQEKCKKEELARVEISKNSNYVGEVGEKVEMTLTHTRSSYFSGVYGTCYIHNFLDENKNIFVYMGGKDHGYEKNQTLNLTFIIKAHKVYDNRDEIAEKQTAIKNIKEVK